MDEEINNNRYKQFSNSSGSIGNSRNLFALIGGETNVMQPYRSKFQIKSIGTSSIKSRDSDLLNKLCEGQNLSKSSKSLRRHVSNSNLNRNKRMINSSNSNSIESSGSTGKREKYVIQMLKQAPKIHNCVCFFAGECLSYNCNCFLSPFPCAPQCCPNCINLKSNLPHKIQNICNCKKTRCLKLYCQCLSKGQFCSVMCRCELCENHEHSSTRMQYLNNMNMSKGCSCPKSKCIKKYCECYANGLKCTNKCACLDCKNFIGGQMMQEQQSYPVKKQQIKYEKMQQQQIPELQFESIDFYSGKRLG